MSSQVDSTAASAHVPPPRLDGSIASEDEQAPGGDQGQPLSAAEPNQSSDSRSEAVATAYVIVVNSLTATLSHEVARACGDPADHVNEHRRIEVCAAVWAAIQAALRASLLSDVRRQVVLKALDSRLYSHWRESLGTEDALAGRIATRTCIYLHHVDPTDPVTTSVRIIELLLDATGVPLERRALHTRLLAGLLAHRIVRDVWLFNEWESQGKLDFGSRCLRWDTTDC